MSRYKLDRESISKDLTDDRPIYILSAYGPGRDTPLQLFGGIQREQSFEELRTRHYELTAEGRQQEAVREAQNLVSNAEQQIKTALNDLDGAIRYICDGENEHPNRIDTCKARGQLPNASGASFVSQPTFNQTSGAPAFGQPAAPRTFGQPSSTPDFASVSTTSAFGKPSIPAFGNPPVPVSAFGHTPGSAFGRLSTPAFGQPSTPTSGLNQAAAPAFGQPAALGRPTTSFGQSLSAMGQPSSKTSAFGQPSSQPPVFGQSSSQAPAFGTSSIQAPAFGVPSVQPSAFGQPLAPSMFPAASKNAFQVDKQPRIPLDASSQPASFGQSVNSQSAGGVTALSSSDRSNPVGLPSTTTAAPPSSRTDIYTTNPFGAPAQPSTGATFGGRSTTAPSQVGQPSTQQQSNPFGQPSSTNSNMGISIANAAATRRPSIQLPSGTVAQKDAEGKLKTWKGREVHYIGDIPHFRDNNHAEWQRIWFPDGPPTFTKAEDLPEAAYDVATKEKYRFATEHGRFENGGIPLMAPRKDWCSWNL